MEREQVELRNPAPVSRIVPSPEDLREAARVIVQARLPLIFAGGGVASSDAEQVLVKLAEATNIPVVTSGGGNGTIPDSHPLCYGSRLSPAGEMHEMNQLFEVMQSADVVIGIDTRFSLGNPAGESCTLININIDDSELTRVQSNTIPLHGDARTTIEALLPFLIEAAAGERPSPEDAVTAARRLIAYYDIRLQELLLSYPGNDQEQHPGGDLHRLGRDSVRLLLSHPLPGKPPKDLHSFRLLVQPRFSFPKALGAKVDRSGPPRGVHHRRRRVHVQRD